MSPIEQILYPTGGAALLLGVVIWFARNLILTRLTNSVSHEFDSKLETLKAELRSREAEIAAVRESATSAMAGRDKAVEERKIQAIDELWGGFQKAKKQSYAMTWITKLHLDNVGKEADSDHIQALLSTVFPAADKALEKFNFEMAVRARPWVSRPAWAYYSAYAAMVVFSISWISAAKTRLNPQRYFSQEHVTRLLSLAIPDMEFEEGKDHSRLFESAGELLEQKLVYELSENIRGEVATQEAISQASKIVDAANKVVAGVSTAQHQAEEGQRGV